MIKVIKPIGTPMNIPSNRSRTPPCPGKKFPVFLIFAFLLRKEIRRSPNWQAIDVNKLITKIL